jgi:hypothetical protein
MFRLASSCFYTNVSDVNLTGIPPRLEMMDCKALQHDHKIAEVPNKGAILWTSCAELCMGGNALSDIERLWTYGAAEPYT